MDPPEITWADLILCKLKTLLKDVLTLDIKYPTLSVLKRHHRLELWQISLIMLVSAIQVSSYNKLCSDIVNKINTCFKIYRENFFKMAIIIMQENIVSETGYAVRKTSIEWLSHLDKSQP